MADKTKEAIDYAKIAEALKPLAETPNPKSKTLADHFREPAIYNLITQAKSQGHKADVIVAALKAGGIETTEQSFNATWGRVQREERGETGAKGNAKPKASGKKNATAKPAETGAEKPTEAKQDNGGTKSADNGTKPAGSGDAKPEGKNLSKQPNMGGAFGDDL